MEKKLIFFAVLIIGIISAAPADSVLAGADQYFFDINFSWIFYPASIHSALGGKFSWMHYWVNKKAELLKIGFVGELGYYAESPVAPWPEDDWWVEGKKARNFTAALGMVINNTGNVDRPNTMEYIKLKGILHSFRSSYPPWNEPRIYPFSLDVGFKLNAPFDTYASSSGGISFGLGIDLIGFRFPSPYFSVGFVYDTERYKERKYTVWTGTTTYEEFKTFTEKELRDKDLLYLGKSQFRDFERFSKKLKKDHWTKALIKNWFTTVRNLENSQAEEWTTWLIKNPGVTCYRTGSTVYILVKE